MRGDVGVSGSADHDLAVVGLPPRGRRDAPPPSAAGWERVLAKCVGHDAPVTCCRLVGDGDEARRRRSSAARARVRPPPCGTFVARVDPVDDVRRRRRNRSRAVLGGQITHHAIHGTTPLAIFRRRERITRVRGRRAGRGGTRVRRRAMGFRRASPCRDSTRARTASRGAAGISTRTSFTSRAATASCADGTRDRPPVRTRWPSVGRGGGSASARGGSASARGGSDSVPRLNDATTGHSRGTAARCVAADGDLFAFGSRAGHGARARRSKTERGARDETVSRGCVNCVAMDSKLRRVVTGGDDCGISVMRLPVTLEDATPSWVSTPLGVLSVAFDHSPG